MNKLKRKGFTLIELLAVIVILAIIALIAVPVVMNIIDKAQKSAFKDSAYGILKAGELYYSEQEMSLSGIEEDKVFEFPNNIGNLKLKGDIPQGMMVITKEGKMALAITNGKYCITKNYDDEDIKLLEHVSRCAIQYTLAAVATVSQELGITKVDECVKKGTICNFGADVLEPTSFAIQVNDIDIHKFYVINDTGEEVTMIMDRNLGDKIAWYSDGDDTTTDETNDLGPITALNYLNKQTKDWDNILAIEKYTYDNNPNGTKRGYQKLEIENGIGKLIHRDGKTITEIEGISRARLLTYGEATSSEVGCPTSGEGCPSWTYINLKNPSPKGYWLLSVNESTSNYAYSVYFAAKIIGAKVHMMDMSGIRPVITISK